MRRDQVSHSLSSQATFSAVKLLTLFSHGPSPVHVRTLSKLPPSMSSIRAVSFNVGFATT
jgi:hypothetical protein